MKRATILLGLCLAASGCSRGGTPDLMTFPAPTGPDEFTILPTLPLQTPTDTAYLPAPTPGGTNLSDPSPKADAVAALGGNRGALARASTDGGLIGYTTRYGVSPEIRSNLAAADLEFRQANRGLLLERLFNLNVYYESYEGQSLNAQRELERFRRAGVPTPAAPPVPPAR